MPLSRSWRETLTSDGPDKIGAPSSGRSDSDARKRHEEVSLNTTVECAAEARATWRQVSRLVARRPQFTTMRCWRDEHSNDRHPEWPSALIESGGGGPASTTSSASEACTR